jgi:hypothetical protein
MHTSRCCREGAELCCHHLRDEFVYALGIESVGSSMVVCCPAASQIWIGYAVRPRVEIAARRTYP